MLSLLLKGRNGSKWDSELSPTHLASNKAEEHPHVFRSLQEFRALDACDHRYCVVDWTEGEKAFLWGNIAHLQSYGMSQEELNNWNFAEQSDAANEYHRMVHDHVQVKKGRVEKLKTAYPKGKPITAIQSFKPIELHLPKWPAPRTVMLMELKEQQASCDAANSRWGLAEEMLRYTEVKTMMFDCESEELEYENQSAKIFYENDMNGGRRTLSDLLQTCVWGEGISEDQALQDIRALTITSKHLELECRKRSRTSVEQAETWHKLHFVPCINPVTGRPALIVNEYDITTVKVQADMIATSQAQETFFTSVSHELRTPLHAIINLSESMLEQYKEHPPTAKVLRVIRSSGLRLAGLVNDILDSASLKRSAFSVKVETLSVPDIAQAVVEALSPLVPKRVVLQNLLVDVAADTLPAAQGDPRRVHQILTNLLGNAVKFTEAGTITLSAKPVHRTREVLVEISDTGIGIAKSKLEAVWAPFKQADMSVTRKYGGTGLGLSLVKELVEAQQGRVGVCSQAAGPHRGSTFFFTLPMAPTAPSHWHAPPLSSPAPCPEAASSSAPSPSAHGPLPACPPPGAAAGAPETSSEPRDAQEEAGATGPEAGSEAGAWSASAATDGGNAGGRGAGRPTKAVSISCSNTRVLTWPTRVRAESGSAGCKGLNFHLNTPQGSKRGGAAEKTGDGERREESATRKAAGEGDGEERAVRERERAPVYASERPQPHAVGRSSGKDDAKDAKGADGRAPPESSRRGGTPSSCAEAPSLAAPAPPSLRVGLEAGGQSGGALRAGERRTLESPPPPCQDPSGAPATAQGREAESTGSGSAWPEGRLGEGGGGRRKRDVEAEGARRGGGEAPGRRGEGRGREPPRSAPGTPRAGMRGGGAGRRRSEAGRGQRAEAVLAVLGPEILQSAGWRDACGKEGLDAVVAKILHGYWQADVELQRKVRAKAFQPEKR